MHAFVGTFVKAWNEHRPVRISPDALWMVLMEGFLRNVESKPEQCRAAMVRHAGGRKVLDVGLTRLQEKRIRQPTTWDELSRGLLDSMDRWVVGHRQRVLSRPFSTSTPQRQMALRLRTLQSYQAYFEYRGTVFCGIPSVTLEGTVADWEDLRARLDTLDVCGLGPWVGRMRHLVDQFVESARGRPSADFWKSFVRYTPARPECDAESFLDGNIVGLFQVDSQAGYRPLPKPELPTMADHGAFPLRWKTSQGVIRNFQLVSGFAGIAQGPDGALSPELGWCVWEDDGEASWNDLDSPPAEDKPSP